MLFLAKKNRKKAKIIPKGWLLLNKVSRISEMQLIKKIIESSHNLIE
ncbi:hypothetical protein NU08_4066 [Flavobacterium anhuiense]|uniref:Uncharacterized protein n=1 Tax=Flavobacterium anhuiense TaxID=459526 RepID=A0A444VTK4_9FLAO|nr:hypothetical protein NU08_4066 [Flavobacterium anhuiense]